MIVESCTACATWDLDFSPGAFSELGDLSLGRLHDVDWEFLS